MSERLEHKDTKKPKLGLVAGAAMLASLSAAEAKDIKGAEKSPSFDIALLSKVEEKVLEDKIPLKLQIQFLEDTFKTGGAYSIEFGNIHLTPMRLSQINKIANTITARLTTMFATQPDNPDMKEYFADAATLRNATSLFRVHKEDGDILCNKFAVRDKTDEGLTEVFEITAFHCIQGSAYEKDKVFHHPEHTEIAVRFIPREEWGKMGIKNPETLPEISPLATPENTNGKVITAFSWGPDGKAKVHLSFAMPMPARKDFMFNKTELRDLGPMGITDMNMFFKPFGEGVVDPETGVMNAGASSGGPVSVRGFGVLGNYSATKQVSYSNVNISYAIAFSSRLDTTQKAIQEEREMRKRRLAEAPGN